MVDGVFFINSALNVNQLSVFNKKERYEQTLKTIESIDKYCPKNVKYIFDGSYELPDVEYIDKLNSLGVKFFYTGHDENVKKLSSAGQRSLAETLGFIFFLNYFKQNQVKAKRIYKISGRYTLNDNFILYKKEFEGRFVFLPTVNSWMPKDRQILSAVDKLFKLRFWHMDYNLLNDFHLELYNIFDDIAKYNIDVEHAYYKNLKKYNTYALTPIGVEGVIAPTGEIINE